jgi:hypothetical protein
MNTVTITFDRVFDIVHRSRRNRVLSTEFGFEARDVKASGVAVPGAPRIEAGMTVTAVLERPDNWRTLLGWVNHGTGEIACRSPVSSLGGIVAMVLGSLWASHLIGTRPLVATVVIVVSLVCFLGSVAGMRKAIRTRRLLEAARSTLAPRDAGSNA